MATFGYTGVDGNVGQDVDDHLYGSKASPASNGTADKIVLRHRSWGGGNCKAMLYDDADESLVGTTDETAFPNVGGVDTALDVPFSAPKPSVLAAKTYYIEVFSDGALLLSGKWQANAGEEDADAYPDPPDPIVPTTEDHIWCIYCDYTVAGALSIPVAMHHYSHHIGKIIRG